MDQFTRRHESDVIGVLSGFDRLRFRGTLRWLANCGGLLSFLWAAKVLLMNFKEYAQQVTDQTRQSAEQMALSLGQTKVIYLNGGSIRKEDEARRLAQKRQVTEGPIGVFSAVEPCFTYFVGKNRAAKKLELRGGPGKCLHYYFYAIDPVVGFMHLRLQTWFPFTIHACINGREWLSRQMDKGGIEYERRDNCFPWIADVPAAQQLLDAQLRTDWPGLLNGWVRRFHPMHETIFAATPIPYYWSAEETEWASDVMFRDAAALAPLYERLTRHAMLSLHSGDVLRFLGRRTTRDGQPHGNFAGAVTSDLKRRPEGVRVKHQVNHNSIKMYDKHGSLLRVETTINDPRDMKVYRAKEGAETDEMDWRRLRKGVADLHRRAEISQAANERYLDGLATIDDPTPLGKLVESLCRPARSGGRRVRAMNPLAEHDLRLLEIIRDGQFTLQGMRNGDLRERLFGTAVCDEDETRRRAAKVSRLLRLLRAHRLIRKVAGTHRYLLTQSAPAIIDSLLAARKADVGQLQRIAA